MQVGATKWLFEVILPNLCVYSPLLLTSTTLLFAVQQADLAALMDSDDSPPAELQDYLALQPRRTDMIMKWLNEPFLKEALEGVARIV